MPITRKRKKKKTGWAIPRILLKIGLEFTKIFRGDICFNSVGMSHVTDAAQVLKSLVLSDSDCIVVCCRLQNSS